MRYDHSTGTWSVLSLEPAPSPNQCTLTILSTFDPLGHTIRSSFDRVQCSKRDTSGGQITRLSLGTPWAPEDRLMASAGWKVPPESVFIPIVLETSHMDMGNSADAEGEGCVTEGREAEDTARDTSVEAANVDRVLSGCWPMIEQQSDGTRFQPAFDEAMSHIIQGSSCLLLLYREPWTPDQLPHSAFYQVNTLPNQGTMGQYLVIGQVASQSPGSDAQGLPSDRGAWDEASSLDSLSPPRERAQGRMSQQT